MAAQESKHGDLNFAVDLKRGQISGRCADHQLEHLSLKYRVVFSYLSANGRFFYQEADPMFSKT